MAISMSSETGIKKKTDRECRGRVRYHGDCSQTYNVSDCQLPKFIHLHACAMFYRKILEELVTEHLFKIRTRFAGHHFSASTSNGISRKYIRHGNTKLRICDQLGISRRQLLRAWKDESRQTQMVSAYQLNLFSMISVRTSFISRPAALTCWGIKLVAVIWHRSSINFKHVDLVHFFTVFTEATSNDIVDTIIPLQWSIS